MMDGTLVETTPAVRATSPLARLPRWQIIAILVGFPALYLANSFAPWSRGLFGRLDRAWFFPFWASVTVLHWASVALVVLFVRRAGASLADLGWVTPPRRTVVMLIVLTMIGVGLVFLRAKDPRPVAPATVATVMLPATTGQRAFWIAMCLTAALCEEFVYRGFGIRVLQARGVRTWLALPMASTSFVFVHGLAGVFAFPIYFTIGLLFCGLFVWRRTLAPGICMHALLDLMAILA